MAKKKIGWTPRAYQDRLNILDYWINRTKSKKYSKKLNRLFNESIDLIAKYPEIGKPTDLSGVKAKVVRNYLIIYQEGPDSIELLTIWDSRRNPDKLEKRLKK